MPNKVTEALRLRNEEGKTYQEIGFALDVSTTGAWKMVNNEKRRVAAELEAERTARAKESEARFDVVKTAEELVEQNVKAAKEDPTNARVLGAAYTGIRLLAQLRGELVEKRETKAEVKHQREEEVNLNTYEELLKRYAHSTDN